MSVFIPTDVDAIPLNFHRMSARHSEERQKLVDILRAESEKVQERMENMIHLGTVQVKIEHSPTCD